VLIGLTGNIATGKSTVAGILRALGAEVIDADQVARQVVRPGQPALAQIVQTFGREVLLPSGELDRAKLARVVFGDQAKLQQLEAIVHPAVRQRDPAACCGDRHEERSDCPRGNQAVRGRLGSPVRSGLGDLLPARSTNCAVGASARDERGRSALACRSAQRRRPTRSPGPMC
jgi:hypothetical protein